MTTILVIDDDRLTRWYVFKMLTRMGYVAVEVSSTAEGEAAAKLFRPALVLLGINLPDQDGLSLAQALHECDPSLPIVLMSAFMTENIRHCPLRLGARGCLEKPIEAGELAETVIRELHGASRDSQRDGAQGPGGLPHANRQ